MVDKKIDNVTLGTDPEVFLIVRGLKDKVYYPVCGLIGGTKQAPRPLKELGDGFAVQEDNVALEFNVPPSSSASKFSNNIKTILDYIQKKLLPSHLTIDISASAYFQKTLLNTKESSEFGCSADYNAWTDMMNSVGKAHPELRSCGGHISVGYDKPTYKTNTDIIKAMDLFLTIPSILLDTDIERRQLYGKAGCFRTTNFGVEFRSLSNFWIANDSLRTWAFNSTLEAIEFINSNQVIAEPYVSDIQTAINTCDKVLAQRIMNDFDISLSEVDVIKKIVKTEPSVETTLSYTKVNGNYTVVADNNLPF